MTIRRLIPFLLLILSPLAWSQVTLTASSGVTSSNGILYAQGTYSINLVSSTGADLTNSPLTVGGVTLSVPSQTGKLSSTATFTITLPLANSSITSPTGTQYRLSICSINPVTQPLNVPLPPQVCFTYTATYNANTDLSSTLSALAPPLQLPNGCPTIGCTFTGPINVPGVYSVATFSGATLDAQLSACLTFISSGGTCDARSFAGSTQTIASTVTCGTSARQTILFDLSTSLQPSTLSTNMFTANKFCQIYGAHVVLPAAFLYTGKVFTVSDNIREGSMLTIDNSIIDASAETSDDASAGYGLYLSASDVNTQSIAFGHFSHIRCIGLLRCVYATNTSTGFINGNLFSDIEASFSGATLELNSAATGSGAAMSGNQFSLLSSEHNNAGAGPGIIFSGTGLIQFNVFSPIKIWDVTTGINVTNSAATGNQFYGSNDGSVVDSNQNLGAFPSQNIYQLTSFFNLKAVYPFLASSIFSVSGAPAAWTGAKNNGILGWNFSGGNGEMDYMNGDYTGANNYAHHFYGANSGSTGYVALGGFTQSGGFILDNGGYQGQSYQIVPASGGVLGPVANQALADDNALGGWNFSTGSTPTNGFRFWKGAAGGTLLAQIDASGNYKNANGTLLPSTAMGNTGSSTGLVSLVPGAEAFGSTTLTSGVSPTISNAAACMPSATCVYKIANTGINASTATGCYGVTNVSAGTSFKITAFTCGAVTTQTGDVSTLSWQIN